MCCCTNCKTTSCILHTMRGLYKKLFIILKLYNVPYISNHKLYVCIQCLCASRSDMLYIQGSQLLVLLCLKILLKYLCTGSQVCIWFIHMLEKKCPIFILKSVNLYYCHVWLWSNSHKQLQRNKNQISWQRGLWIGYIVQAGFVYKMYAVYDWIYCVQQLS